MHESRVVQRRIGALTVAVADDQPSFWDRVEAGAWEPGTLAALDALVGPGCVFLDLGAWVGALSLYAASRGATVLAVEADPAAQDQFRRNLAVNPGLEARIALVPRAVAATPGPVRFGARRKPGDSMSSALLVGSAVTWEADTISPTELAALVPADRHLVVKLDVEGGEYDLLPALAPLFDRPGCAALVAFHPDILAEAGGDVAAGEATVRRVFAGWRSHRVELRGAVPRSLPDGTIRDEWLFILDPPVA